MSARRVGLTSKVAALIPEKRPGRRDDFGFNFGGIARWVFANRKVTVRLAINSAIALEQFLLAMPHFKSPTLHKNQLSAGAEFEGIIRPNNKVSDTSGALPPRRLSPSNCAG